MKLVTWNINALGPTVRNIDLRHGSLAGFVGELEADILCLQETKLIADKLTRDVVCISDEFESFWASSQEKLGYSGVVTYVRKPFSPVHAQAECIGGPDEEFANEGRSVLTDHGSVVIINCYVPNAGGSKREGGRPRAQAKMRFLYLLQQKVDLLLQAGRQVIVCGDLNVAASQQDVHQGLDYSRMYSLEEKRLLEGLLHSLADTWRRQHPDTSNCFTVWDEYTNARVFNRGCRIDYVLVSPGLTGQLGPCEVLLDLPPKWSDHAPVKLTLPDLPPTPAHAPCPLSSHRHPRFSTRTQPSVASLFARSGTRKRVREDSAPAETCRPPAIGPSAAHPESGPADQQAAGAGQAAAGPSSPAREMGCLPAHGQGQEQPHLGSAAAASSEQAQQTLSLVHTAEAASEATASQQSLPSRHSQDHPPVHSPSSHNARQAGTATKDAAGPAQSADTSARQMHTPAASPPLAQKARSGPSQRTIATFFAPAEQR